MKKKKTNLIGADVREAADLMERQAKVLGRLDAILMSRAELYDAWLRRHGLGIDPGRYGLRVVSPAMCELLETAVTLDERRLDRRRCRVCGCTDLDCRQCIEKTGMPCHWVEPDLCSACAVTIEVPSGLIPIEEAGDL